MSNEESPRCEESYAFLFNKLFHAIILLATLIVFSFTGYSEEAGKIYSVQGTAQRREKGGANWIDTAVDSKIARGDAIRTGDASRIAILGTDGLMVRLGPNSLIEYKGDSSGLQLDKGDAHVLSRDPHKSTTVTTTVVSGSIRGTEFAVSADSTQSQFTVMQGAVTLNNDQGSLNLTSGEASSVSPGANLVKRLEPQPYNSVRWAFRYPPIISRKFLESLMGLGMPDEKKGLSEFLSGNFTEAGNLWRSNSIPSKTGRALILWRNGKLADALSLLDGINTDDIDILRARMFLEGGDVSKASTILDKLESKRANHIYTDVQNSMILAQKALIQVVQGNIEGGFKTLDSGEFKPAQDDAELLFARSIAFQAAGDIGNAAAETNAALALEPDNSWLLARKAELLFGSGKTAEASSIAQLAVEKDPSNSEALTVLGFILVSRGEPGKANEAFETALRYDPNSSKAHLGLGLVAVSSGDLDGGRIRIQEAVLLDPRVSLYRSYLGKAFFENEREVDATKELELAKSLDPNDPTPYLYDAFNQLARFQPVLALGSIEDSIARNDNRAVYRSRLMLDQDHATRASGLGKVFAAIDFVGPAQVEALKSLTEDPGNYSAHFLYKDALIGQSINTAFISSEATGTLLAPSGFSSLLPTASSGATLNEYTTLFERSQSRTGFDTIFESKERRVDGSIVHFAGGVDHSYLLRYGATYADGYRDNDFQRQQTARALGQYDITPDDKLLLEWIGIGSEQGDTNVGIDPYFNDPDSEFDFEDYTVRLGWRHAWDSASNTLVQGLLINSHFDTTDLSQIRDIPIAVTQNGEGIATVDDVGLFTVQSRTRTRGGRLDAQHIWNAEKFSLVAGGSTVFFEEKQGDNATLVEDDQGIFEDLDLESDADIDARSYKGYAYGTLKPEHWLKIVTGAAYTSLNYAPRTQEPFSDDEQSDARWTPKVGLFATPTDTLTLRGAYFESLGSTSTRDLESIEPVQVAGLRQLYDDQVATYSRNWAFGADWKLPKSTYVGTEFLLRNLTQPGRAVVEQFSVDADTGSVDSSIIEEGFEGHSEEHTVRAYINQVLCSTTVASLEYDFTESEDDLSVFEVDTHRSRLGLAYFSRSGFFAFGSATYRYQERDNYEPDVSDSEAFWIMTGGAGYQLPHRRGSIQVSVQNIFEEDYRYISTSQDSSFPPGLNATLGISLNF